MPRKPTEFGTAIDLEIEARAARGESAATIANALGMPNQLRTIGRRLEKLKSRTTPAKASPSRPRVEAAGSSDKNENEPNDVPDNVPEGTTTEQLDRWIRKLEQGAAKAEEQENLSALASIAAKVTALMALKHRSAPLPKPDPNENPDMKALAKQGEKRLLALLHDLFRDNPAP